MTNDHYNLREPEVMSHFIWPLFHFQFIPEDLFLCIEVRVSILFSYQLLCEYQNKMQNRVGNHFAELFYGE